MKYMLLARPSALIVNDMKRLVSKTGLEPQPLTSTDQFHDYDESDVGGIVISTALSSKVNEKYWEVIEKAVSYFPGKPIFLASFSTVESTKLTAGNRLKEHGISLELISIEEAQANSLNSNQILILTQKEISDMSKLPLITKLLKSILTERKILG